MRGASADSGAALADELAGALDSGADVDRVAGDLFGVAEVLRREPRLRRLATDPSIDAEAKADLMRSIFAEQLDPASTDLIAFAVGRRWAGTRDLADALEHLGVVAVVRQAEQSGEGDALEDELFAFGQLVGNHPDLRDALSTPARSAQDKRTLLDDLLGDKVTPATMRLAQQSITGSHRTVVLAVEEYQRIAAEHRDRVVALVLVARDLAEDDAERLERALADQYGRPVHLNVMVDPDVLGGIRVEIGAEVIDGTVASRLDEARRRLAG